MTRRRFKTLAEFLKTTSETEFARELSVGQPAVSQWKTGKRTPKPALALKIHRLTGVPLEELLKRKQKRAEQKRAARKRTDRTRAAGRAA